MAVPDYYDMMKFNPMVLKLGQYAAQLGISRWISGISESEAIKHGSLTNEEKDIYRAVFYHRTATPTMLNEVDAVKSNASLVKDQAIPEIPIFLFLSNGSGTGFKQEEWRKVPKNYFSQAQNVQMYELDVPHYLHDYEYSRISQEITHFIQNLK